jgi:hypothetical protein
LKSLIATIAALIIIMPAAFLLTACLVNAPGQVSGNPADTVTLPGVNDNPPLNETGTGFQNRMINPNNKTRPGFNGSMGPKMRDNTSDAQGQQRFEAVQQKAEEACTGKNEGDACTLAMPMGEAAGTCKLTDAKLLCAVEMPNRNPN